MIIQSCHSFYRRHERKRQSAVEDQRIKRFTTLCENAKKWHEHTVLTARGHFNVYSQIDRPRIYGENLFRIDGSF